MNNEPTQSPLGRISAYVDHYDASLLFPIPRQTKRDEIGVGTTPIFMGADLWTAYELSWLNFKGKPQVAVAHFVLPSDSPNIIESKSLKLYLNSFNSTQLAGQDQGLQALRELMMHDLSDAAGARVAVGIESLHKGCLRQGMTNNDQNNDHHNSQHHAIGAEKNSAQIDQYSPAATISTLLGTNLDRLDIACVHYNPAPELLTADEDNTIEETVYSDLLKSNCLVTGQPDWGSVQITYQGAAINHAGLLQYIVSFRNHNEFHEQCVERIFMDIWNRCKPTRLSVYARYTRRGGLDINPFRTSYTQKLPTNIRLLRQ